MEKDYLSSYDSLILFSLSLRLSISTVKLVPSIKAPKTGPKSFMLTIIMMVETIPVTLECEIPYLTKFQ